MTRTTRNMSGSVESMQRLLHDLNNDLGVVIGHLDLALRHADKLDEATLKRLETIKKATARMGDRVKKAQADAR